MTIEQVKDNLSQRDPDEVLMILGISSETLVIWLDEYIEDRFEQIKDEL